MQINNNINSMMQLEKNLDKSANAIASMTNIENATEKQKASNADVNLVTEMVKQIEIPIAYTANAEVVLTQNSVNQTLLDIKA